MTCEDNCVLRHIKLYLVSRLCSLENFILNRYKNRPEFELYDIKKDPFEMNNLADMKKYSKKKAELTMELQKWMKQQNDTGADKDQPRTPKNKQKKAANA